MESADIWIVSNAHIQNVWDIIKMDWIGSNGVILSITTYEFKRKRRVMAFNVSAVSLTRAIIYAENVWQSILIVRFAYFSGAFLHKYAFFHHLFLSINRSWNHSHHFVLEKTLYLLLCHNQVQVYIMNYCTMYSIFILWTLLKTKWIFHISDEWIKAQWCETHTVSKAIHSDKNDMVFYDKKTSWIPRNLINKHLSHDFHIEKRPV